MTLAAGTRLGRYEIRSKIGAGGMGEVYLAHKGLGDWSRFGNDNSLLTTQSEAKRK